MSHILAEHGYIHERERDFQEKNTLPRRTPLEDRFMHGETP